MENLKPKPYLCTDVSNFKKGTAIFGVKANNISSLSIAPGGALPIFN